MAKVERVYNIPLRKEWLKAPSYKRSKKAITAIREFLTRHMKSDNIRIGKQINEKVWANGIKNPPHHIKVNVVKEDDGLVKAELFGVPEEKKAVKKEKEVKAAAKQKTVKKEEKDESVKPAA